MSRRILVVDNYDSFVFNLVHYLQQLGAQCDVRRNDESVLSSPYSTPYDGVVISPGPGSPEDAGNSASLIRHYAGVTPILGVCLGLQIIATEYGATIVRAPEIFHGKTSLIHHNGKGIFAELPNPFTATRYHSLTVDAASVPPELDVTATTDSGVVMGIRHATLEIHAVQFHPEAVLTNNGHQLLANWLKLCY